jgi:hypothetical protein
MGKAAADQAKRKVSMTCVSLVTVPKILHTYESYESECDRNDALDVDRLSKIFAC